MSSTARIPWREPTPAYAARLGIEPPDVEHFIDDGAKLLHFVVLVLIESSRPLTLDELVRRLGGNAAPARGSATSATRSRRRGTAFDLDLDLEADELR